MKKFTLVNQVTLSVLLFSPFLCGADLSTYRGFQFGMSLSAAARHSGMDVSEVTTLHQRPALIQELTWNPDRFSGSGSRDTDPVEQVLLSFYDGHLFRIAVNYDAENTTGLTSGDLIAAVSAKYGTTTRPGLMLVLPSMFAEDTVQVVARWEDADNLFSLIQLPYGSAFQLLMLSKRLNALADTALAEGVRLDAEEAPALLKLKEENAKADLSKDRSVNRAHFRP